MNVILTKYNTIDLPAYDEHNIAFQLNKRCKRLPKEVTLAYFVAVLGMAEQYDTLKSEKADGTRQHYSF